MLLLLEASEEGISIAFVAAALQHRQPQSCAHSISTVIFAAIVTIVSALSSSWSWHYPSSPSCQHHVNIAFVVAALPPHQSHGALVIVASVTCTGFLFSFVDPAARGLYGDCRRIHYAFELLGRCRRQSRRKPK